MSDNASNYPVSVFLNGLIQQYGGSPTAFIQSLGYRNIERGLRRLEPWLAEGEGFYNIIGQISKTYGSNATELDLAIAATLAIKKAEREAEFLKRCKAEADTFVPYIIARGETITPNGICIFGISGGHQRWTIIRIPQRILDFSLEEQLAAIPELMSAYLKEYEGQCPFFGKLTGFRFVRLVDYFQFDKEGNFIEHVQTPFRAGYAYVSLR